MKKKKSNSGVRPPDGTPEPDPPTDRHQRRPRYSGKNPRRFQDRYKELNPERYAADVQKVLDAGKTPAGMHRPVLVAEILDLLAPQPGDTAVDCTVGGGGHARAILDAIRPGGRLIGLDLDPLELPRTEARLRAAGYGADVFVTHRGNYAGLPRVLATAGVTAANVILADLGVSSMQLDNPDRGFTYKEAGPLDMRMNPSSGETAAQLLARLTEDKLAQVLEDNADEPRARVIASLLKSRPVSTTAELGELVRAGIAAVEPGVTQQDLETSLRRTCQALRIAVNDEFSALDMFLRNLGSCLAPGGRVVVLTFHSGEDRRVKRAFAAGLRAATFSAISTEVVRPTAIEVHTNPRASSAKLRWAVRSHQAVEPDAN